MAVRGIPGVQKKRVGNYSVDELQKLLRERVAGTSSTAPKNGKVDIRAVPGSNERRTGIPADLKSRSQRGTAPPGQRGYFPVKKSTPALDPSRRAQTPVTGGSKVNLAPKPALVAQKNPLKNQGKSWDQSAVMRRLRKRYKIGIK